VSANPKFTSKNANHASRLTPHATRLTSHASRLALLLFLLALAPRLPGLARFLTSDEKTNIFIAGSDVIAAFLRGDLRGTYWHFYPGVTMSWLDALGMVGQYWLDTLWGGVSKPFAQYIYGDILSLVVAGRLPYVLLTAAAIPATYLLAKKLLPGPMALLGALFMAFDPFYLAHSRVAHGDAPVAVFMSLSTLCFFIYARQPAAAGNALSWGGRVKQIFTNPYLIASAVLGSLAALTKAPGQFMALFIIGLSALYAVLEIYRSHTQQSPHASRFTPHSFRTITHWLAVVAAWGLISFLVFVLLWPAMWVDPLGTLGQMWRETFGKVNEGHLVYFMGQPTLDPGPWFYLYVIPFRLTPVVLIGSLLSLLLFVPKVVKSPHLQSPNLQSPHLPRFASQSPLFLLWLFTISLLLFGNLSPKKQDRYLLPLLPFLNLLAAVGWVGVVSMINYQLTMNKKKSPIPKGYFFSNLQSPISIFLLLLHALPVFTYYPYYLTYFNPLLGGPARAAQTTLMGWGEGMEQVAAYLNSKPNAQNLYVASTPSQTLLPYFAGTGENFYTNDVALRADYVVLYLAQMQRLAPSPEIVRYFQSQTPEKVITIKGVPYAKIYPGPKLILSDIPPDATPANIGLDNVMRLAGYKLPDSKLNTQNSKLTLYWHALAPISKNYTISVRARTADGRLLAQQDQWPVGGLLPTSQWRQGDYVVDTHTLEIPAGTPGVNHFEIVVYNAGTGQPLGPPITINNEQLSMNNEQ